MYEQNPVCSFCCRRHGVATCTGGATTQADYAKLFATAYTALGKEKIVETAVSLVLLWDAQKVEGLSRQERNDTIAVLRDQLCEAVYDVYPDLRRERQFDLRATVPSGQPMRTDAPETAPHQEPNAAG